MVSTGDCFLRDPFEDFDDGSVCGAHHDRWAVGNEALGTERREVVSNQFKQRLFASGSWLIAGYRDGSHGFASVIVGAVYRLISIYFAGILAGFRHCSTRAFVARKAEATNQSFRPSDFTPAFGRVVGRFTARMARLKPCP